MALPVPAPVPLQARAHWLARPPQSHLDRHRAPRPLDHIAIASDCDYAAAATVEARVCARVAALVEPLGWRSRLSRTSTATTCPGRWTIVATDCAASTHCATATATTAAPCAAAAA